MAFAADPPATDGHILVVPKEHVASIHALPIAAQKEIWSLLSEVPDRLRTGQAHSNDFSRGRLKLALKFLHACQDTFHVVLRLAKRRDTLVTINRTKTSIIRPNCVPHRVAGVAMLLNQKSQVACASVNILFRHARIGTVLAGR